MKEIIHVQVGLEVNGNPCIRSTGGDLFHGANLIVETEAGRIISMRQIKTVVNIVEIEDHGIPK